MKHTTCAVFPCRASRRSKMPNLFNQGFPSISARRFAPPAARPPARNPRSGSASGDPPSPAGRARSAPCRLREPIVNRYSFRPHLAEGVRKRAFCPQIHTPFSRRTPSSSSISRSSAASSLSPGSTLPARKFPFAFQFLAGRAPYHQHPPAALHRRRHHHHIGRLHFSLYTRWVMKHSFGLIGPSPEPADLRAGSCQIKSHKFGNRWRNQYRRTRFASPKRCGNFRRAARWMPPAAPKNHRGRFQRLGHYTRLLGVQKKNRNDLQAKKRPHGCKIRQRALSTSVHTFPGRRWYNTGEAKRWIASKVAGIFDAGSRSRSQSLWQQLR